MQARDEDDGGDPRPRLTVAEIRSGIGSLTDADLGRLNRAARAFSAICRLPAEDLIQEAYARVLEGKRTCDRGTGIVSFLCGVMKSISSHETEARQNGQRPGPVLRNGQPVIPDIKTNTASPEDMAASVIDDRPRLLRISEAVKGDEKLELLLEGILDNWRGADLRDLLDVDDRGLAALRKRLSRRLADASAERTER
jgi:DNA-directed RNA polymerase specialized sigma24 family protein